MRPRRTGPAGHAGGFTLIELLVVIAIIALLVTILMPSLNVALDIARTAICRANLRHLQLAYALYLNDSGGEFFPYYDGPIYMPYLLPYHGDNHDFRLCPTCERLPGNYVMGDAKVCWVRGTGDLDWGSYGISGWLFGTTAGGNPGGRAHYCNTDKPFPDAWYRRPDLVDHPSRTPSLGNCVWDDGWPWHDNPPEVFAGDYYWQMTRFVIDRHSRAVNMAFMDGHVEGVPLPALWLLQWSPLFEPCEVELEF